MRCGARGEVWSEGKVRSEEGGRDKNQGANEH